MTFGYLIVYGSHVCYCVSPTKLASLLAVGDCVPKGVILVPLIGQPTMSTSPRRPVRVYSVCKICACAGGATMVHASAATHVFCLRRRPRAFEIIDLCFLIVASLRYEPYDDRIEHKLYRSSMRIVLQVSESSCVHHIPFTKITLKILVKSWRPDQLSW